MCPNSLLRLLSLNAFSVNYYHLVIALIPDEIGKITMVILHTVVDDNDSSQFFLVCHRIFNIMTVKQFDYILLFMNMSNPKYHCFSHIMLIS